MMMIQMMMTGIGGHVLSLCHTRFLILFLSLYVAATLAAARAHAPWPMYGKDPAHLRNQPAAPVLATNARCVSCRATCGDVRCVGVPSPTATPARAVV